MAFIDTQGSLGASAGSVPSGAGVQGIAQANGTVRVAPGTNGFGGSLSVRTWVFIYLGFIIGFLVLTGVLFNGKGRK